MVGVEKRQERPVRVEEYERHICSLYIYSKEKSSIPSYPGAKIIA